MSEYSDPMTEDELREHFKKMDVELLEVDWENKRMKLRKSDGEEKWFDLIFEDEPGSSVTH